MTIQIEMQPGCINTVNNMKDTETPGSTRLLLAECRSARQWRKHPVLQHRLRVSDIEMGSRTTENLLRGISEIMLNLHLPETQGVSS